MLIDSIAGCHLAEFEERLAIRAPTCHSMLPVGMFALDITGSTTELALHSTKHQQLKCSGHHFWWGMGLRRLRARLGSDQIDAVHFRDRAPSSVLRAVQARWQ